MRCRRSTAHCPQALGQCIAGGPLPTAPRQWGSILQEVHCPLPPGSEAVHCRRSTAHCPQAVRKCIAGGPLPTAPRQSGSALQEIHCPLPPGTGAVYCRSCAAHGPQAVGQCVAGGPLPTAPGREAVYGRSTTAHCPQAMRQCEARFPMPTALRRRGSALQCPLPSAQNNSTAGRTQCSIVHSTKQCKCSAQHQAVQHHTNSTDGAARHAGCSGPMRPCATARRRRQGSVGQVRKCTGPAMQQHTYTQRAHNTHSPARLPVPVGRHPGLCLLVIAPSAHHTTPHHTTPHHTTTAHHTSPFGRCP